MHFVPLRESLPDHAVISGGEAVGDPRHLLLVDDDPCMISTLGCYFEMRGFTVVGAHSIGSAKKLLSAEIRWALVIADFHLPDGTGWDFFRWMEDRSTKPVPFLLISGSASAFQYAQKVKFLAKPFSIEQLEQRLESFFGNVRNIRAPKVEGRASRG